MRRALSFFIAASLLPVPGLAARADGEKTEIRTAAELAAMGGSGEYILMNDIDLSGAAWEPIKNASDISLDGGGHTIYGLTVISADGSVAGLFGENSYAEIYDLRLENVRIDVSAEGDIQAGVFGADHSPITAYDCSASGSISVSSRSGAAKALGVYSGIGCLFEGELSAQSDYEAQVIGVYEGTGCVFDGDITAESVSGTAIATGIGMYAEECEFNGSVYADSAGGVAGAVGAEGKNSRCDAELSASSETGYAYAHGAMGEGSVCEGSVSAEGNSAEVLGAGAEHARNLADLTARAHGDRAQAYGTTADADVTTCENSGNVTAVSDVYAYAYGAQSGTNSGDVLAEGGAQADAVGAAGGTNTGSVTAVSADGSAQASAVSEGAVNKGTVTARAPKGNAYVSVGPGWGDELPYNFGDIYAFGGTGARIENEYACNYGNMRAEAAAGYASVNESTAGNGYCGGELTAAAYGRSITKQSGESGEVTLYKRTAPCDAWCPEESRLCADVGSDEELGGYACQHFTKTAYLAGETGAEPTPPPAASDAPEEDGEEKTYMITVLSAISNEPVEGAKINVNGKVYTTNEYGSAAITDRTLVVRDLTVMLGENVIYSEDIYYAAERSVNTIYTDMPKIGPEAFAVRGFSDTIYGPSVNIMGNEFFLFELPLDLEMEIAKKVKLAYDPGSGKFQVLFGSLEEKKFKEFTIGCANAEDSAWKKAYEGVKQAWLTRDTSKLTASGLGFEKVHPPGRSFDGSANFCGFLEFTVNADGKMKLSQSGFIMEVNGEVTFSAPIPSAPWAYVALKLSAGLETAVQTALAADDMEAPMFELSGETEVTAGLTLGIGTGIKDIAHIEGGLGGDLVFGLELPFVSGPESFSAKLNGKLYAEARFLAVKVPYEYEFASLQIYPPKKEDEKSAASSEPKLIDRSYLDVPVTLGAADSVKAPVYPYGEVSVSDLGGGRELLVWLDDAAERTELADKTALFYSVGENGAWSEPRVIADDGTADFEFSVSAADGKAAVVWQNASGSLAGTDVSADGAYAELASAIGLSCAVFDGEGFSEPFALELPEGGYPHAPETAFDGERGSVIWLSRDISELTDGKDALVSAAFAADGSEGGFETKAEDITAAELVVVSCDEYYYIADTDNDANTDEDRALYANGYEMLYGARGLWKCGDRVYAADGGKIYEVTGGALNAVSALPEGADPAELILADGGDGFIALYAENNGEGCTIRAAGQSAEPVFTELCETAGTVLSLSAFADENGKLHYAAVAVEGDPENVSARLAAGTAALPEKLEITELTVDAAEGELYIELENDSSEAVTSAEISIESPDGAALFSAAEPVYIPARGGGSIALSPDWQEGFAGGEVIIRVSAGGLTAEKAFEISGTELRVESAAERNGTAKVRIANGGIAAVNDAELRVLSESGEVLCSAAVGALNAGDTVTAELELPEEHCADGTKLRAEVTCAGEDAAALYNNSVGFTVGGTRFGPMLRSYSEEIDIGETVFAEKLSGGTVRYMSSDTEVAEVSAGGAVTGKRAGSAVIYVFDENGGCAELEVTVSENTYVPPSITIENAFGVGGEIEFRLRFENAERGVIAAAVYDGNGILTGLETVEKQPGEDYVTINVPGIGSKAKAFLWASEESAYPLCPAAEADIW